MSPPSVERKKPLSVPTSTTSEGPLESILISRTCVAPERNIGLDQLFPPSVDFNMKPPTCTSNGSPVPRYRVSGTLPNATLPPEVLPIKSVFAVQVVLLPRKLFVFQRPPPELRT